MEKARSKGRGPRRFLGREPGTWNLELSFEECFMRRIPLVLASVVMAVVAGRAVAEQSTVFLDSLHEKAAISDGDRQMIRQWLGPQISALIASTEPDRKALLAARVAILFEGRKEGGNRSPAFLQAFAEETVKAIEAADRSAVSAEARLNLFMVAGSLKRPETVPLLLAALQKEPYAASKYWAARGLNLTADAVIENPTPRLEQDMADGVGKALEVDLPSVTEMQLFEMLGKLDHERAHDVLADSLGKFIQHETAADPIVSQILASAIPALEKAYAREVRPEAKVKILSAYAMLCAWIMPPAADPTLLFTINGEKVGFQQGEPVFEKMAMMEWVTQLVRTKKIAKLPPLPPAIEDVIKEYRGTGGAAPAAPAPAPESK
jgi:hypothetical protein